MAQATNSVAGSIILSGDLCGGNDAYNPTLGPTGVVPWSNIVCPVLAVDAKGRITDWRSTTSTEWCNAIPSATTSTLGLAYASDTQWFDITNGVLSVKTTINDATTLCKGFVSIGSGLEVNNGLVAVLYSAINSTLTDATISTKGIMQVSTGLSITTGTISLGAPDTTTSTKGIMRVGSGLSVTSGVVSLTPIADATTSTKGIMQVGSGLSVTTGEVSLTPIADATTSTKGIMQVGSGLSVAGGIVTTILSSDTTVYGVVKSADAGNIAITSGAINVGSTVPQRNTLQQWTKAQNITPLSTSVTTTYTPDFSVANTFILSMGSSDLIVNTPTNIVAGGIYQIIVKNNSGSTHRVRLDASYLKLEPLYRDLVNGSRVMFTCIAANSTTLLTLIY